MPSVIIPIAGRRYAAAVTALRRARRCWHALDRHLATATGTGQAAGAARQAALDVLPALDRHLDTLDRMLTRMPESNRRP